MLYIDNVRCIWYYQVKMPDQDLFQMNFAPGWRRVYRLARDGAGDDSEIGVACIKAIAMSLRETKGCPGFNEIAQIVTDIDHDRRIQPLFVAGGALNLSGPLDSIRREEEQYQQHRMTKIAARAVRSLIASEMVNGNDAILRQNLAEKTCQELVDHYFFGRGRNYLAEHRFGSFEVN
jgi:hypothetical protein